MSIYEEFKENGFKIKKRERTGKRGGGLLTMTNSSTINKLSSNRLYPYTSFDNITCKVTVGKLSFTIVNLYRAPACSKSDFLIDFENFLSKVLDDSGIVVILGDFNVNWFCKDSIMDEFIKILNTNGLTQMVNMPTRKSSLLDFVIIQECYKDLVSFVNVTEKDFESDHIPIFF